MEEILDVDIMDEDDTFNTPACTREVARPGNARDHDVDGLLSHASFNLYMPRSHNTTLVNTCEESSSDECNEAEFVVSADFNLGRLYNYGRDMLRNRASILLPDHVQPRMPFAENLHTGEREIVQLQFGSMR